MRSRALDSYTSPRRLVSEIETTGFRMKKAENSK